MKLVMTTEDKRMALRRREDESGKETQKAKEKYAARQDQTEAVRH